jgi:hypothetical protein
MTIARFVLAGIYRNVDRDHDSGADTYSRCVMVLHPYNRVGAQ